MRKVMQLMPVPTAVVTIKLSQGKKDLETPNTVSDRITYSLITLACQGAPTAKFRPVNPPRGVVG